MTPFRTQIAASILISLSTGAVFAQVDRTKTGVDPLSTEKAPNTTVVGQTKPPSRDASPTSTTSIERKTPRQTVDDAISTRVCVGCGGEPATTGALPVAPAPAAPSPVLPPQTRDVRLDELRTPSEPKKQPDLDTFALASAHRERAESAQEKTNGLWQSWLVSVCDGCGDQKPAKALKLEDWPNRTAPLTTGSVDQKTPAAKINHAEAKRIAVPHQRSLEADLSPDIVDSIRRMPQ
ncbi:hypothetical protein MMSR116_23790 [Methylobacterium mesophilicum SR1.6/6]|uniref:Secreted protein n=1 Tax=Methylobacterium mesophilicum SR1.6/6 TaxID=908290 RepID=A0A6B9FRC2_9HYPH|nr:hypothetical protein [Methylobacterium mesophilicum]QGY04592.1 hypothetical protein MMSR116_23790 [Methylobacterium mesophilicum SR1.6/6]